MSSPAHGPFGNHDDVMAAAQPLLDALHRVDPAEVPTVAAERARARVRLRYLLERLEAAGVTLGDYDLGEVRALADTTVTTLVMIGDWLARAYASGNAELLGEAAEYVRPCMPGADGRCEHGQWAGCAQTDVAYRLRGLDPSEARKRALDPKTAGKPDARPD